MSALAILAGTYLFVVVCWALYLAIMNLARVRDQLHPVAKVHAYLLLFVGYPMDAILNLVFCLVIWRRPRDLLFTGTLKRTLNNEDGWRETVAAWVCRNLLDQFDPKGKHC
jgi:hypothetical protein